MTTNPTTRLAKAAAQRPAVPSTEDPREELRRLVREHRALTRSAVSAHHQSNDRTNRTTGEKILCPMPADVRAAWDVASKAASKAADKLKPAMERELRKLPVWTLFLDHVYGVGPILGAYLCAMVRIDRCPNPSNLRRYCGVAPDTTTGKREVRHAGPKCEDPTSDGTFNAEMRMRLWQFMTDSRKNSVGKLERCRAEKDGCGRKDGKAWVHDDACPHCAGTGRDGRVPPASKYLKSWNDAKHRALTIPRADGSVRTPGKADDKGRLFATDRFLDDLYLVWRSIDGLDVRVTYWEARRGREHGGAPVVNEWRRFTVEEALARTKTLEWSLTMPQPLKA